MNLIYFPLGVLPSLIWLLFYLREDVKPEPKKLVIKVFILGMLFAFPAALFEFFILRETSKLKFPQILNSILANFLIIALIEETAKYLVVKKEVLKSSELDEPIDLMLYMIISALGFAATENVLLAFSKEKYLEILVGRFLSATFLHALCSGILGYFLALSFLTQEKKKIFLFSGFFTAIFLHGLYNFSIIEVEGDLKFSIIGIILIFSAVFVRFCFQRLKKIKSICKI